MDAAAAGLLGAMGTAVVGIGGAALRSQTAHRSWLRSERLAAYSDLVAAVTTATGAKLNEANRILDALDTRSDGGEHEFETAMHMMDLLMAAADEVRAAAARCQILGPDGLTQPANRLTDMTIGLVLGRESSSVEAVLTEGGAFAALARNTLRSRR